MEAAKVLLYIRMGGNIRMLGCKGLEDALDVVPKESLWHVALALAHMVQKLPGDPT